MTTLQLLVGASVAGASFVLMWHFMIWLGERHDEHYSYRLNKIWEIERATAKKEHDKKMLEKYNSLITSLSKQYTPVGEIKFSHLISNKRIICLDFTNTEVVSFRFFYDSENVLLIRDKQNYVFSNHSWEEFYSYLKTNKLNSEDIVSIRDNYADRFSGGIKKYQGLN